MTIRKRGFFHLLLLLCTFLTSAVVSAQTTPSATLRALETSAFPIISAFLNVHDDLGGFVSGLQPSDITIVENGSTLPIQSLQELRPGALFVVAINPGPSFEIRNSQAISRYDYLIQALTDWAARKQGSNLDDLSLLTSGGSEISHVSEPVKWQSAVSVAQVDVKKLTPNLDLLFRAASLAADPTPRPGMGRSVLFITAPLEGDLSVSLTNLISQAKEQDIAINVWIVSSPGAFDTRTADQLIDLAKQTGGQYFLYSGAEDLPDIETYIEPLRNIYSLTYTSHIKASGKQRLFAQVGTPSGQITSESQSFDFSIQPPQPAFVSPPIQIVRKPPPEMSADEAQEIPLADYQPSQHQFQVVFDFSDGRPRPLSRTALYVDGALVDENLSPPFDQFDWDLAKLTRSGVYTLQAEAEDAMGMVGKSIETPVEIKIETPAPDPFAIFAENIPILAGTAILLSAAVLFMVLFLGGRIRPHIPGKPQQRRRKSDPVTQPIPVKDASAQQGAHWADRLKWPHHHTAPPAYALLNRLTENDEISSATPIPITTGEVTIGRDPAQATLVLNDPSLDPLHARLTRSENGVFRLADNDSVGGTWINYSPVSKEGTQLEHGDLVHFGHIGFRFIVRQPIRVRKPVVIYLDASEKNGQPPRT